MSARGKAAEARAPGAEALLGALTEAGVVLIADGARLRVRVPAGALSPELREALAARRDQIQALVAERFRGSAECLAARAAGAIRPCRRMSPCARPVHGRACLIPATCCDCGGELPPGLRYRCPACTAQSARVAGAIETKGDPIP